MFRYNDSKHYWAVSCSAANNYVDGWVEVRPTDTNAAQCGVFVKKNTVCLLNKLPCFGLVRQRARLVLSEVNKSKFPPKNPLRRLWHYVDK